MARAAESPRRALLGGPRWLVVVCCAVATLGADAEPWADAEPFQLPVDQFARILADNSTVGLDTTINTTFHPEPVNYTNETDDYVYGNTTYTHTNTSTRTTTNTTTQTLTTSTTLTTTSYIKNNYWQSISCGADYTLGVTTEGTGWKWGIPMSEREKAIIYPGTIFKYVAAGYSHSCSVTREGETYCWGRDHEGQSTPPRGVYFDQLTLGEAHTCGLTDRQELLCWGDASYRRLQIPTYVSKWLQVSAGAFHTCALSALGKILCWGHEGYDRLEVPYNTEGNILWEAVSCGSRHCCGMLTGRAVRIKNFREEDNVVCWGDYVLGQLVVPGEAEGRKGVQERFIQIAAGHLHTCALTVGGRIWCWGDVSFWGLVSGIPVGENITRLYSGGHHSCAMTIDLRGICWGDNYWHQSEVPPDDRTLPPTILDYHIHPMDIWAYAPWKRITRFDDAWPIPHHTFQWLHMACFIPEPAEAGTLALVFTQWAGTSDLYSPHIMRFPSPRYDIPGSWEVNVSAFDLRKWHDQRWGFNAVVASVTSKIVNGFTEHRLVDGGRYRVDLTYEDTTDHVAANHTIEAYDVEYDLVTLPPVVYSPRMGRTKQGLWVEYALLEPMQELDVWMLFTGSAVEGELARDDSAPHEIQLRKETMTKGHHIVELHLRDTETNIYFERHPNVSRTFQAGFQTPYRELTSEARYTFQIRAVDRFNNPPAIVEVPNVDYFIDLITEPILVIRPTELVDPLFIEYFITESVDIGTLRVDFIWLQNKPDEPLAQPDKQSPHMFWVRPEKEVWNKSIVMKFGTADLFKDVDDILGVRAQPDVLRFESKGTPVVSFLQPWSQYLIRVSYLDRYRNPRVYTNLTLWTNFTAPDAPEIPYLITATTSTLTIGWTRRGTGGARILEYDLEIKEDPLHLSDPSKVPEASLPLDFFTRTVQGQKTNITTVRALRSARHFQIRVRARNVLGSSPWSNWTTMRTKSTCGDGRVYDGEECDDGNLLENDGCSTLCRIETGWRCSIDLRDDPSNCVPGGMDGIRVGDEECDDCNNIAGDGCGPDAKIEFFWDCEYMGNAGKPITCSDGGITFTSDRCYIVCGDGLKHILEECDDGNKISGDGCSNECKLEPHYTCQSYYPNMLLSVCDGVCGDGYLKGSEQCDDGNLVADDGCTADCKVEPGYLCERKNLTVTNASGVFITEYEECRKTCFNGLIDVGEECDDANVIDYDGCTACKIDPGWRCELIANRAENTPGSYCVPLCGDGYRILTGPRAEDCDDGNNIALDGCSPDCTLEPGFVCQSQTRNGSQIGDLCTPVCGDSITTGGEGCDDGNTLRLDGCGKDCQEERGYTCRPATGAQTSLCVVTCGDGTVVNPEACDDGNTHPNDGCSPTCEVETGYVCPLRDGTRTSVCAPKCGDGILIHPEECDDGGVSTGDGCSAECTVEDGFVCPPQGRCIPICGDAIRIEGEDCDDGNVSYGDGCDSSCVVEPHWECRSYVLSLTSTTSVCKPICGDGFIIGSEECDDGNLVTGDGCDDSCRVEVDYTCCQLALASPSVCTLNGPACPPSLCGNGVRDPGEECDDGNSRINDGCSNYCKIEQGWECENFGRPEVPDICMPVCGDGYFVTGEECDDSNTRASDGCGSNCRVETGFACTRIHRGAVCLSTCGDGIKNVGEECDDANFLNFDGCDRNCRIERGFRCRGGSLLTSDICEPICGDGVRIDSNYTDGLPRHVLEECDTGSELDPGCNPITCKLNRGYTCERIPGTKEEQCHPVCGDGNVTTPIEQCDDGNTIAGDGCGPTCEVEAMWECSYDQPLSRSVCGIRCGDGRRHQTEACDDGNSYDSDGCNSLCLPEIGPGGYECLGGTNSQPSYCKPVCGDGIQVYGEDCDDGNLVNVDGCDSKCQIESMYYCTRAPGPYVFVGSLSRCSRTCGDAFIQGNEECDDVVVPDPLGILNQLLPQKSLSQPRYQRCEHCRLVPGRRCGDGLRGSNGTGAYDPVGDEECDDGNNVAGDGCDPLCRVEPGWRCVAAPVYQSPLLGDRCSAVCGDGVVILGQEECDDGNLISGDGCDGACRIEPYTHCFTNASSPVPGLEGSHCIDATPPRLVTATMDPTYARMKLVFNVGVAPLNDTGVTDAFEYVSFNCTLLLDYQTTVRNMGFVPKCSWLSPREVLVEFGVDPFLVPGHHVTVNGGVLRRYPFAAYAAESHVVRVDADMSHILEPDAIISGPQMTSTCVDETYIDSSYSTGHAGRALQIRWYVRSALSVVTHKYNDSETGRLAYAISKFEKQVKILFPRPGFIQNEIDYFVDRTLKPDFVYIIGLEIKNAMGLLDSTFHVIYTTEYPVPLVTSALGTNYRRVPFFRWAVLTISADFPPECFATNRIAVASRERTNWVHSLAAPGTPYVNVNAQNFAASTIALRPGTLQPGRHSVMSVTCVNVTEKICYIPQACNYSNNSDFYYEQRETCASLTFKVGMEGLCGEVISCAPAPGGRRLLQREEMDDEASEDGDTSEAPTGQSCSGRSLMDASVDVDPDFVNALQGAKLELVGFPRGGDYVPGAPELPEEESPLMELLRTAHEPSRNAEYLLKANQLWRGYPLDPNRTSVLAIVVRPRSDATEAQKAALAWLKPRVTWQVAGTRIDDPVITADPRLGVQELGGSFLSIPPEQMSFGASISVRANVLFDASQDAAQCKIVGEMSASATMPVNAGPVSGFMELRLMPFIPLLYFQFTMQQWATNMYPLQYRIEFEESDSPLVLMKGDWSYAFQQRVFLLPRFNKTLIFHGGAKDFGGSVSITTPDSFYFTTSPIREILLLSEYREGAMTVSNNYNKDTVTRLVSEVMLAAEPYGPMAKFQVLQDIAYRALGMRHDPTVRNCSVDCGLYGGCPAPTFQTVTETVPIYAPVPTTTTAPNASNISNLTVNSSAFARVILRTEEVTRTVEVFNLTQCVCQRGWIGVRCERSQVEADAQVALTKRVVSEFQSLIAGSPTSLGIDPAAGIDTLSMFLSVLLRIAEDCRRMSLDALEGLAVEMMNLMAASRRSAINKAADVVTRLLDQIYRCLPTDGKPTEPLTMMPSPLSVLDTLGSSSICRTLNGTETKLCYDLASSVVDLECPMYAPPPPFLTPIFATNASNSSANASASSRRTVRGPVLHCRADLELGLSDPYPCHCPVPKQLFLGYGRSQDQAPLWETLAMRDEHAIVWRTIAQIFWNHTALAAANGTGIPPGITLSAAAWFAMTAQAQNTMLGQRLETERLQSKKRNTVQSIRKAGELLGDALVLEMVPGQARTDFTTASVGSVAEVPITTAAVRNESGTLQSVSTVSLTLGDKVHVELDFARSDYGNVTRSTGNLSNATNVPPPFYAPIGGVYWRGLGGVFTWLDGSIDIRSNVAQIRVFGDGGSAVKGSRGFTRLRHRFLVASRQMSVQCNMARPPTPLLDRCCAYQHVSWSSSTSATCVAPAPPPPPLPTPAPTPPPPTPPPPNTDLLSRFGSAPASMLRVQGKMLVFESYFEGVLRNFTLWAPAHAPVALATKRLRIQGGDLRFGRICSVSGSARVITFDGDVLQLPQDGGLACTDTLQRYREVAAAYADVKTYGWRSDIINLLDAATEVLNNETLRRGHRTSTTETTSTTTTATETITTTSSITTMSTLTFSTSTVTTALTMTIPFANVTFTSTTATSTTATTTTTGTSTGTTTSTMTLTVTTTTTGTMSTATNTTTTVTTTTTSTSTSTTTGWCFNGTADASVWCPQGYTETRKPVYADVILEDPEGLVILGMTGAQMAFAEGKAVFNVLSRNVTAVVTDYSAYYLFLQHSMLRPPGGPPGSAGWFNTIDLVHSLPRYDAVNREFLPYRPTTTTTTTQTLTLTSSVTITTTTTATITVTTPQRRTPPAVLLHFLEGAVDSYLDLMVEAAGGSMGTPTPVRSLAAEPFAARASWAAERLDLWSEATITKDISPILTGIDACADMVDIQEGRPLEELLSALDSAIPDDWNGTFWAQYPGFPGWGGNEPVVAAPGNVTVQEPCVVVTALGQPLRVTIVSARGLRDADSLPGAGASDPYVIGEVRGKPITKITTPTMQSTSDPVWNHEELMQGSSTSDTLTFRVMDGDPMKGDDRLGEATLNPDAFLPNGFDGELPLSNAGTGISAFLTVKVALTTGVKPVECVPPPECTFDVVNEFECVAWSVPLARWAPALGCKVVEGFKDNWIPDTGFVEVVCDCEEGAVHAAIAIASKRPPLPPTPKQLIITSRQFYVDWYTKLNRYNLRGMFMASGLFFLALIHIIGAFYVELKWRHRARRVHRAAERSLEVQKNMHKKMRDEEEFRSKRLKEFRQWMPEVPRTNIASMAWQAVGGLASQAKNSVLALANTPQPAGTEVALFSAKSLDMNQGHGGEHKTLGRMNEDLSTWAPYRAGVRPRKNADGTFAIEDTEKVAFVAGQPLKVTIVGAKSLRAADVLGKSDPYCVCEVLGKPEVSSVKTDPILMTLNPVWNYEGEIHGFNVDDALVFTVYDKDFGRSDEFLGKAVLQGVQFLPGGFEGEVPLLETQGVPAFLEIKIVPGTPDHYDAVELDDKETAYMVRLIKQRVPYSKIARLLGITLKQVQDVAATVKEPDRNDGPVLLNKYIPERCPLLKRMLRALMRASPGNVWRACQNHHRFVAMSLDSQHWVFSAPERVAVFHMSLWWTAMWQAVCFQMDVHIWPGKDPVCPSSGMLTLDCLTYSNALWMTFLSSLLATLFSNMTMVLARGRSFIARTKLLRDDDREEAFLRHFLGPYPMIYGAWDEVKARFWNWYVVVHAYVGCCCCCCRRPKLITLAPLHWLPSTVPALMALVAFLTFWYVTRTMFFFSSSWYMHEDTYSEPPGMVKIVVPPPELVEQEAATDAYINNYIEPWRIFIPQMQRFMVLFVISAIFQMLVLDPLVLAIHLIIGEPTLDEAWDDAGKPALQALVMLLVRCFRVICPRRAPRPPVVKDAADIAFENGDVEALRRIAVAETGLMLRVVKNMTIDELYQWIKHPEFFDDPDAATPSSAPASTAGASPSTPDSPITPADVPASPPAGVPVAPA